MKKNALFLMILVVILVLSFTACEDDLDADDKIPAFTDIDAASDYLFNQKNGLSVDDPIFLPMNIRLGDMESSESGWGQLLYIIGSTGRFVNLDLSLCRMNTEVFLSPKANIGKNRIVSILLPNMATSIRSFSDYISLKSVTALAVTSIGSAAFSDCKALESVYIPAVTTIMTDAFRNSGSNTLTIIMGSKAPTFGYTIFYNCGSKNVIVRVPRNATGYGNIPATYSGSDATVNWGNGFRGRGWDGTGFILGIYSLNSYITLTVEYLEK